MGQRTWGVVEVLAAHGTPKTDVVGLTAFALHAVFLIAHATRTRAVTPQSRVDRLQHLPYRTCSIRLRNGIIHLVLHAPCSTPDAADRIRIRAKHIKRP